MSQDAQSVDGQMKKCPKCQETIQLSAKKCKHCGADLRNWFVKHKILTAVLVLFVLGFIGSAAEKGVSENSANSSPSSSVPSTDAARTPNEPPAKPAEPTPIKITASQLFSEYAANEIAADNAYKGKILEVSGTISNIAKDILDNPYVTLKTQAVFGEIQCLLKDSEQGEAATLKNGMSIVVRGRDDGKLGNVILRDCEIVQ